MFIVALVAITSICFSSCLSLISSSWKLKIKKKPGMNKDFLNATFHIYKITRWISYFILLFLYKKIRTSIKTHNWHEISGKLKNVCWLWIYYRERHMLCSNLTCTISSTLPRQNIYIHWYCRRMFHHSVQLVEMICSWRFPNKKKYICR